MKVEADNETWRLAIGDKEVTNETSPYHVYNSGLWPWSQPMSEARDILQYCRTDGGLIAIERNMVSNHLRGCWDFTCENESPLGRILKQLEIEF